MLNHKRSPNLKVNDGAGIVVLIILLVILPIGVAYLCSSIFGVSVWLSIIIGLVSSIAIFLNLVFLLGATFRFPDHLPGSENDWEV